MAGNGPGISRNKRLLQEPGIIITRMGQVLHLQCGVGIGRQLMVAELFMFY
jgi:hypothetical protein